MSICRKSGPFGNICSNKCTYSTVSAIRINKNAEEQSTEYKNHPDLDIYAGRKVRYRIMMTQQNGHMIDSVLWSEIVNEGVDEE